MPQDPAQDKDFSVGNASRNKPSDVLYIKSLLFAIPDGKPGALTASERVTINESSRVCEPSMIAALARIQNAYVASEKKSGGRVVAWSKTLALLKKNAAIGVAYDAAAATREVLYEIARKAGSVIDTARVQKLGSVGANAGKPLSGGTNAGSPALDILPEANPILDIDLSKWMAQIEARKTPFKVTGGIGAQAGVKQFGGGVGTVEVTDTSTAAAKTYAMYFGSLGASLSSFSFSFSGPSHPSGAVTHIYKGPLRERSTTLENLGGTFVAVSGGVAGVDGVIGGSVTIYFFGFSLFDFRPGVNPGWEMLQKCAGITMVWGTSSGLSGKPVDAGVQFQTGKLLGKLADIVAN
jgi:hypothetical protein